MPFRSEKELFNAAVASSFFQDLQPDYTFIEPKGLFGIPDLVYVSFAKSCMQTPKAISYAFEMKLSNWQRALMQAFRYKAFATMSFVVMDYAYVGRALRNIGQFRSSNIGLISVERFGSVNMHYMPEIDEPYSPQLESTLLRMTTFQGDIKIFTRKPTSVEEGYCSSDVIDEKSASVFYSD